MHSRRSQRHWLGARIEGQWDGLFHTPSIPNLGAQSYSYDKYSLMQSFYEQVYEITIFLSQIALHKNSRYTEDASS